MTARWSFEPVCGSHYFTTVALSPEVLVFLFFMITDPRTTPRGRVARTVFGVSVGTVGGLLVAFQRTEFATKVGILAALVIVCLARPLVERACPARGAPDDHLRTWIAPRGSRLLPRLGRATGLVLLPLLAYLVWVAELNQRFGEELVSARVEANGPRSFLPDVVLPPVSIDVDAARTAQGFDLSAARAAARDVLEDLELEIRAVTGRDSVLARTSSAGARLDAVLGLIDAARGNRDATIPTYRFTTMRAVLSRESPQASPVLRFETVATVVDLHADGTLGPPSERETAVVITLADGVGRTHLIASAT
jgi:hypothetical protein